MRSLASPGFGRDADVQTAEGLMATQKDIPASRVDRETNTCLPAAKDSDPSEAKDKVNTRDIIFSLLPKDGSSVLAKDIFEELVWAGHFKDLDTARDAVQVAVLKNPSLFSFQSKAEGLFLRASETPLAADAAKNQAEEMEFGSPNLDQAGSDRSDQLSDALGSEAGALRKKENAFIREQSNEICGALVRVKKHILHDYFGTFDSSFIKINLQNLMVVKEIGDFCRLLVDFSVNGISDEGDEREELQNRLTAHFARSDTGDYLSRIFFPKVGEHCIFVDEENAKCYRAEVLRYVQGGCSVRLIDFWEEREVEVHSLRSLPADLAKVPAFGLELFTPLFAINRGKEADFQHFFDYVRSESVASGATVSAKICRNKPNYQIELLELQVDLSGKDFSVMGAFLENELIHFM